jgi:adenine specific DNA methylase Mod
MREKQLFEKPTERIICGDNLISIKGIVDESIDLCYIDPPFFTSKTYEVIWNDGAEIRQFNDRWITSEKDSEENPKRSSKDINVYLEFMQPRIEEIYRVLKPTGSFYLHCDDNASHYLKVLCDKIFGYNNFVEECIWHKKGGIKGTQKMFPRKKDTLLFYVKNKNSNYTFNVLRKEIEENALFKRWIKYSDDGETVLFKNFPKADKVKFEVYTKRFKSQFKRDPLPEDIIYEFEGAIIDSVWEDIADIYRSKLEKLGYPTQKPEALLERIIKASSNEGDLVLDTFCGCGTAIAVAKKLNRQFIGMDVSPTACRLIAKRLGFPINVIEGLPINKDEIGELDGNEFQNFIIREFGGFSGKRGADGGIDGQLGKLLIQVKKFKAGRMHLDEFSGMLLREGKKEGVFIALEYSKDFRAEVARLKSENQIIIHYFDVQDIIDKKHYELVSKNVSKKGLEKYDAVKTEYEMKE